METLLWNDLIFFGSWIGACAVLYCLFDNLGLLKTDEQRHKEAQHDIYWIRVKCAGQNVKYKKDFEEEL